MRTVALPSAGGFVLHLPHKPAAMKGITRDSGLKDFNNRLFARVGSCSLPGCSPACQPLVPSWAASGWHCLPRAQVKQPATCPLTASNHVASSVLQANAQMRAGTYLPFVADPQLCYTSSLWDS